MIIPIYREPKFKEGDIIISLEIIEFDYCVITPYHEFTITKIDKKKKGYNEYYTLTDKDGFVYEYGKLENYFTLKVELSCAKKRNKELNDDRKFYKFIEKNCPHIHEGYEDRDTYKACKISNSKHYSDYCKMKFECINHIDDKIIQKDKFILKYLRNKKLKKLNENTEI